MSIDSAGKSNDVALLCALLKYRSCHPRINLVRVVFIPVVEKNKLLKWFAEH